ncbi:hypothetical protein C1645_817512 [Glomus cerebriforme]|uniref:DH domain-containing protein n=1 Tax=Glomus cerebriforme TaxID=658196 RepID=A0A397T9A3_9GLOM|nr:hypothetical protein C1645_817512 [Glomus cerebriforme]
MSNTSFEVSKSPLFLPKPPFAAISPIMPLQKANQYLPYNPINDLIETEEEYIDDLRCLLQQISKSWNRDNPLPPELKVMLDILGEIHQYNRNFCSRLNQIGTDLVSAKELGNALMTWVKEMEGPYSTYCKNYRRGVDLWPEIDNNLNLQQTLNVISAKRNKPVTLDYLFEAPLKRIRYYKKLYMRILKSSEPGRPDYDILVNANKRIDNLIELEKKAKETNKQRSNIEDIPLSAPQPILHTFVNEDKSTVNDNLVELLEKKATEINKPKENIPEENIPLPAPQSVFHTFISPVNSQEDITKINSNTATMNLTLPEFENQLDTSRVRDLFTKQQKTLKVQLLPPHLPFRREILLHDDFIVILPDGKGSGKHRAHINAHLILFTDLLLVCQQLTPEEKTSNPTKDFWLLYPPLSGRHLVIHDIRDDKEEMLNLVVLQKESMVFVADNRNMKEKWFKEINKVIEFAKIASSTPQINTNVSSDQQLSISTQGISKMSPSTGIPLTPADSGRAISPPWSPGLLSPHGPMKMGLPSSPLSNSSPLLRTRSPDQIRNASPPNSSQTGRFPDQIRIASPTNFSQTGRSPDQIRIASPSSQTRGYQGNVQSTNPTERSNSTDSIDSISSIASFTETIQQTPPCEINCWVEGEWVPITKDRCFVEIRMTNLNRPCWVALLESSRRTLLSAWIHPKISIYRESINSLSVSCEMGQSTRYYKMTMTNQMEADRLFSNFLKMKNYRNNELIVPFVSRSSSLKHNQQQSSREIEQTLTEVMESRVKLFLQSDHGVWTNLGWGNMKLILETPSHRKRIIIQSDKQKSNKLVDSFIAETGVGKVNKANITFKINIGEVNIIYMMQMKDEANATKALEIMKTEQKS